MSQITEKKNKWRLIMWFFSVWNFGSFLFAILKQYFAIYLGILGFCFTSRASRYECENFALVRFAIVGDL